MTTPTDRHACHLCGAAVVATIDPDPHRRVLCPTCTRRYPDDVETGPAPYRMGKAFAGLDKGGPKLQLGRFTRGLVRIWLTAAPENHVHLSGWPLDPVTLNNELAYELNMDSPGLTPEEREDFKRWVREANARKLEERKTKT